MPIWWKDIQTNQWHLETLLTWEWVLLVFLQVQRKGLCQCLACVSNLTMSNGSRKRRFLEFINTEPPVFQMSGLSLTTMLKTTRIGPGPGDRTPKMENSWPPTWEQLKKLSHLVESKLLEKGIPKTDANMLVSMLAAISVVSCLSPGVAADNFTYWAYLPNPLLLTPLTWNDDPPIIYINDSSWFPNQKIREVRNSPRRRDGTFPFPIIQL